LEPSENIILVHKPESPSGKRRPCGTLLQLVVVILDEMHRIGRSVESAISVAEEQTCNTTRFFYDCLSILETAAGGQFDWGGALSKRYR
jgi:hypothetical protein